MESSDVQLSNAEEFAAGMEKTVQALEAHGFDRLEAMDLLVATMVGHNAGSMVYAGRQTVSTDFHVLLDRIDAILGSRVQE